MMDWINVILTLISIVATFFSIKYARKSKRYKEEILNQFSYIDYYKFIIEFHEAICKFINISKLQNWNRGNKAQSYIDKISDFLSLLPRFYFHFNDNDIKKISALKSELQIDLCNLKQDDIESLNRIRANINSINEITQSNLNKIQNKAYQKKL